MAGQAMLDSWKAYESAAFGRDELLPVTRKGEDSLGGLGVALMEAMPTLQLMGLQPQLERQGLPMTPYTGPFIPPSRRPALFSSGPPLSVLDASLVFVSRARTRARVFVCVNVFECARVWMGAWL